MTAQVGVQRARALALLIQSDPSILKEGDVETTTVNLGKIARLIKVDEIDVTDENGFIIASWPTGATESAIIWALVQRQENSFRFYPIRI